MELIDKDKLDDYKFRSASERMDLSVEYMSGWNDAIDHIEANAPRVYAETVRHGRWNETNFLKVRECSCCHAQWGMYSIEEFDYCPTCGAKMDERREK